jgi:hypothetical protein
MLPCDFVNIRPATTADKVRLWEDLNKPTLDRA